MDSEKLIHCLQCCARVDAHNGGCDDCGLEYCGPECQQLCGTAATVLSTLQAENEKLRAEMKQERAHRLHAEQHADAFLEDCKRLNAELENYRKGHCSEGGCAAEKDRDAVLAELEQVKAERDAALEHLHGICSACKNYSPYHNRGKCRFCAYEPARDKDAEVNDNWEWRGPQKED